MDSLTRLLSLCWIGGLCKLADILSCKSCVLLDLLPDPLVRLVAKMLRAGLEEVVQLCVVFLRLEVRCTLTRQLRDLGWKRDRLLPRGACPLVQGGVAVLVFLLAHALVGSFLEHLGLVSARVVLRAVLRTAAHQLLLRVLGKDSRLAHAFCMLTVVLRGRKV